MEISYKKLPVCKLLSRHKKHMAQTVKIHKQGNVKSNKVNLGMNDENYNFVSTSLSRVKARKVQSINWKLITKGRETIVWRQGNYGPLFVIAIFFYIFRGFFHNLLVAGFMKVWSWSFAFFGYVSLIFLSLILHLFDYLVIVVIMYVIFEPNVDVSLSNSLKLIQSLTLNLHINCLTKCFKKYFLKDYLLLIQPLNLDTQH